jgi:glycosyltransferase involved in cell wall biosynthesis
VPNKVLIVTYYWPPSGGAGVQRWLKFSKYLPEYGWEPIILTIDPVFAAYPATDISLEKDVLQSTKVYRTKATDWFSIYSRDKSRVPSAGFANSVDNTLLGKISRFIRGNFFIPDPRRGWNKFAFKKACELIRDQKIGVIITTSPPHSTQLIGLKLKRKFHDIKWIADLRDPWTDIYYYDQFYPTFVSKAIDSQYERNVLKNADRILTVGPSLKSSFMLKLKGIENKTDTITNGFDEMDFAGIKAVDPSLFTITYVGTLSSKYPISGFLNALGKIRKSHLNFLLRFVGTVPENIRQIINSGIPADSVEFVPYCLHDEAIAFMMKSSMLLLIIPEHVNNKNIITGKIFEYIASGKPVLCLGPEDGDAAAILSGNGFGRCFGYDDITKIKDFIMSVSSNPVTQTAETMEFSHRNIAKKLAKVLSSDELQCKVT